LEARKLVKLDTNKKKVEVGLENGSTHTFKGDTHKFTPLGQAYFEQTEKEIKPDNFFVGDPYKINNNLKVIIGPVSNNVFMLSSKQKHMLAAYNAETGTFNAFGFFY